MKKRTESEWWRLIISMADRHDIEISREPWWPEFCQWAQSREADMVLAMDQLKNRKG